MKPKTKAILAWIGIGFLYLVGVAFLGSGTQTKTPDAPYLIVAGWAVLAIAIVLNIVYVKVEARKKNQQKEDKDNGST